MANDTVTTLIQTPFAQTQQLSRLEAYAYSSSEYVSYAGTDIVAEIILPGEGSLKLGELHTISWSIHRENTPVRILGHVSPVGFVKGPRTIAGSLIFVNFDQYAFYRLERYQTYLSQALFPLSDMLPPFDIVMTFINEYGTSSKMRIYGVTIVDEGGTMSIDDLVTESTYTYMARAMQPMTRDAASDILPPRQASLNQAPGQPNLFLF